MKTDELWELVGENCLGPMSLAFRKSAQVRRELYLERLRHEDAFGREDPDLQSYRPISLRELADKVPYFKKAVDEGKAGDGYAYAAMDFGAWAGRSFPDEKYLPGPVFRLVARLTTACPGLEDNQQGVSVSEYALFASVNGYAWFANEEDALAAVYVAWRLTREGTGPKSKTTCPS